MINGQRQYRLENCSYTRLGGETNKKYGIFIPQKGVWVFQKSRVEISPQLVFTSSKKGLFGISFMNNVLKWRKLAGIVFLSTKSD